jgi:hypothetical protein
MGVWLSRRKSSKRFLKCHTKAHLIGHGVAVDQSAIDPPLKKLDDTYRHGGSNELRAVMADGQLYIGTPSVQAIRRRIYALITDCSLSTPNLEAELHGLRLVRGTGRERPRVRYWTSAVRRSPQSISARGKAYHECMEPHLSTNGDQLATNDKPLVPGPGPEKPLKKSPGMTRKGFGQLIKRAFTQEAPKSPPKSTS